MQLSIDIPETLVFELKNVANTNEFIINALQKALETVCKTPQVRCKSSLTKAI